MDPTITNDKTETIEQTPVKAEEPQVEQKELKKQGSKTGSQKKSGKKESGKSKNEEPQLNGSVEQQKDAGKSEKKVETPVVEAKKESAKSNKEAKKSTVQSKKEGSTDSDLKINENKALEKKASKQVLSPEEPKKTKNMETPLKKKPKKTPVKRKSKVEEQPVVKQPEETQELNEEPQEGFRGHLSRNLQPGVTTQKMYSTSVAKRAYTYLKDFDEQNYIKNKLERVEADKLRLKAQLRELDNESNYLKSQLHRIRNQHAIPRPVEINYNVSDNLGFLRTINNEKKMREDRMRKMRETHKQKQVLSKQQLLNQEKQLRERLLTDKKKRILNNINQINERANIRKINNNMSNKLVKDLLRVDKEEGIENQTTTNTE